MRNGDFDAIDSLRLHIFIAFVTTPFALLEWWSRLPLKSYYSLTLLNLLLISFLSISKTLIFTDCTMRDLISYINISKKKKFNIVRNFFVALWYLNTWKSLAKYWKDAFAKWNIMSFLYINCPIKMYATLVIIYNLFQ